MPKAKNYNKIKLLLKDVEKEENGGSWAREKLGEYDRDFTSKEELFWELFNAGKPPPRLVSAQIKLDDKLGNIPVDKSCKGGIAIAREFIELETAGKWSFFDSVQVLPIPKSLVSAKSKQLAIRNLVDPELVAWNRDSEEPLV